MVFPHPFSPALLTSSAVRTPENTDEGSVDAEPADEGDVQMEYLSDQLYSPSIGALASNL